jgi:hypothetical protein
MLDVLSRYRDELELTSSAEQLALTKKRTDHQLQSQTAIIRITDLHADAKILTVGVQVQNKTGHKFPAGFPSRRAWVHLLVTDEDGLVLFESGKPSSVGAIIGNDADSDPTLYERHFSIIQDPGEVQIYEVVMGDLKGEVTYTLLEASDRIKDNRLLPVGFSKTGAREDIQVIGDALEDENFLGGSDALDYVIPLGGADPPYLIRAELLYQSVSHAFWRDLTDEEGAEKILLRDFMRKLGEINYGSIVASANTVFR